MALGIEIVKEGSQAQKDYDLVIDDCAYGFVQQSSVWRDVIKDLGPDEPYLLLARDNRRPVAAFPLYLYRGKFGNIMTSVPQPGPLGGIACVDGYDKREALYEALIAYALDLARKKGCCLLTIITNPFSGDDAIYRRFLLPEYELENFTQYIAISKAFDAAGRPLYLNEGIRRNLGKAEEAGIVIREGSPGDIGPWHEIHKRRYAEIKAAPFRKELFLNILNKAVARGSAKFLAAYKDDKLVGGCFCIFNRHVIDYYLMHSSADYFNSGVNYALINAFLCWAGQNGLSIFNWQSSPARSSGVYEFKRRWASEEAKYYFLTKSTGDVSGIMNGDFRKVRQDYINHYLLPCRVDGDTQGKAFGAFVQQKMRKQ